MMASFEVIAAAITGGVNISTVFFIVLIAGMVQVFKILVKQIEKFFDKREKRKGIVKRDAADAVIQKSLDEVMSAVTVSERIQIIEFTNGNKNIAQVPFNLQTCTYESFAVGKTEMASQCKNVPTPLIGSLLQYLATSRQGYIFVTADKVNTDIPAAVYDMLAKRNATVALYVPIKSPASDLMIGYATLDCSSIGGFAELAVSRMTSLAAKVGVLLTMEDWI